MRKYDFEGNIDTLVSNGNYWINTENASGTMPNNGYFQLQVNSDGYNHIQRAFLYIDNVQPPYIYVRMHTNGSWTTWGRLMY